MPPGKGFNLFLEALVMVAILGSLTSVSLPYIGKLVNKGKIESYQAEYHNIQTAVTQMLADSTNGTLRAAGPTRNMRRVRTTDEPPLILSNYLLRLEGAEVRSGCFYIFHRDGTITQLTP